MARKKAAKVQESAENTQTAVTLREARTPQEMREALTRAILVTEPEDNTFAMALRLSGAAEKWPEEFGRFVRDLSRDGSMMSALYPDNCNATIKTQAKLVLVHRQQIIRELEISSTAEFMLLDAAMDAYVHWMYLTALARATYQDGTGSQTSKYQARVVSMAQSYMRTYAEAMKTLSEMKLPPLRVLKVQAGQNVAVQVNEQAKGGPDAPHPHQETKRTKFIESTPASAKPAEGDSG